MSKNEVLEEFKINELLSLRLEKRMTGRKLTVTYIHVAGEYFRQCKYLLLEIPKARIKETHDLDSIDEAIEHLDKKLEREYDQRNDGQDLTKLLSPEEEFWGHCSNLQAWAENDYDTRLLHSNLSFPLLKALSEKGDSQARKVFKEEIARRFHGGYLPVMLYLLENHYLDALNDEEKEALLESVNPSSFKGKSHLNVLKILAILATSFENKRFNRMFKEEIIDTFRNHRTPRINHLKHEPPEVQFLLYNGYLNFLSDEEKVEVESIQQLRRECLRILNAPEIFTYLHDWVDLDHDTRSSYRYFNALINWEKDSGATARDYHRSFYHPDYDKQKMEEHAFHPLRYRYYETFLSCMRENPEEMDPNALKVKAMCRTGVFYALHQEDFTAIRDLKNILDLNISKCNLRSFTGFLSELTIVMVLDLSENQLKTFPSSLLALKSLKYLDIYDNGISEIPESINELDLIDVIF